MIENWLHRAIECGCIIRNGCHPGVMILRRRGSLWLSVATRWERVYPDNDNGTPT